MPPQPNMNILMGADVFLTVKSMYCMHRSIVALVWLQAVLVKRLLKKESLILALVSH